MISGEHQILFGDKFHNYINKTVKTRQKSEELFESMNKGKSQYFRQGPTPHKKKTTKHTHTHNNNNNNSSGGLRINFSRRPGPDSTPTSTRRQGSGKSSSEKGTFLQHASKIDSTKFGEDTFCGKMVSFTRDCQK